jgi:hypothetical protein
VSYSLIQEYLQELEQFKELSSILINILLEVYLALFLRKNYFIPYSSNICLILKIRQSPAAQFLDFFQYSREF